jgi:hypothetical protein
MPSAPRESPFDCVARCASSRSFHRYARRLPPMTMLASPEVRQAIKDSRGKCRSRWLGHHTGNAKPQCGHFRPVQVSGHGWFTDGLRPERGHSRRGHGRGHGLTTDAVAVTASDCSRTWSVRDHGITAERMRAWTGCGHGVVADWTRPRIGHGLPVATDIGAAICPDKLRIHRDYFADAKASF